MSIIFCHYNIQSYHGRLGSRRNPQRASEKVVWPPRPNIGTYAKALFWIQGGVTQARMTPGHAKKPFYFKKDDFGLPMRTPHPICAHMCSSTLHLDAKIQFFRFFANLPHLGPPSPAPWVVSEQSIFELGCFAGPQDLT